MAIARCPMHEPVTDHEIAAVLRGPPSWITPDLIRNTLTTWQPYYKQRLTAEDAYEILTNTGRLFKVLSEKPKSKPIQPSADPQEEHRAQGEANRAALN